MAIGLFFDYRWIMATFIRRRAPWGTVEVLWRQWRKEFLTHVNPESRSSRSAMASTSVKGRVCATQKPTEFYVCRKADPHAEVHDHSIPNFTITKGVGLWARTHPKKEDRTDTLPGRDSSLIKLVTRLFQADCH